MITIRDLVRNSLRMRPERIVVGEVRSGGEALDMLQAMNTGMTVPLPPDTPTPAGYAFRLEPCLVVRGGWIYRYGNRGSRLHRR